MIYPSSLFSTFSQRKCYRISICLVMWSWNQGSKIKAIHDWLSQWNDKTYNYNNHKSLNNLWSHKVSFVAKTTNIYSNSIDEKAIVAFFTLPWYCPPHKIKKIPIGWLMKFRVINPINIYPTLKEFLLGVCKVRNVLENGKFQITKDAFDNSPMQGTMIGHEFNTITNCICKIWPNISDQIHKFVNNNCIWNIFHFKLFNKSNGIQCFCELNSKGDGG